MRDLALKEKNTTINSFQQLFNISPHLNVKLTENPNSNIFVVSEHSGKELLTIEELNKLDTKYRIAKGALNPMIGWHSIEHGKLIPSPSLVSEQNGKHALYVTHIKVPSKNREKMNSDWPLKANFIMKNANEFSLFIRSSKQEITFDGNKELGTFSINHL